MFERSVGSNSILSFFEEPADAPGDLGTAFLGDSSPLSMHQMHVLEVQAVFSSKKS
jgi:hypothetical protein